jgi:hypothetical protein
MDASNVIHIPIIRPVNVIRFNEKPKIDMDIRVSKIEMGIDSPIIRVAFILRRKIISISMARSAP